MPETVPVCRQCHKTCLNNNQNGKSHSHNRTDHNKNVNSTCQQQYNDNSVYDSCIADQTDNDDDWRPLMLMGLSAINPAASLVKLDPFAAPVPKISVVPPTPDNLSTKTSYNESEFRQNNCNCQHNVKPQVFANLSRRPEINFDRTIRR